MAIGKETAKMWLSGKGFVRYSISCTTREEQYMDQDGVNLFVNFETGDFRFAWMIPHSLFRIESGNMSPVWNLDFLEKMYQRFLKEVAVHKKGQEHEN